MSALQRPTRTLGPGRSLLALALSVLTVVSGLTPGAAQAAATSTFVDVPPSHQFAESIEWMAEEGVTTGYPVAGGALEFRPLGSVTRDAMAAFLYRYAGVTHAEFTPPAESPFVDVSTTSQFYREIAWLAEEGISTGWEIGGGQKEFRPLLPIARDAMAVFLHRFSGSPAVDVPVGGPFVDVSSENLFAEQITWLSDAQISTGWDLGGGRRAFAPLAAISREAMAAFLHRHSQLPDLAPDPVLSSIQPASGSLAGGDFVTLTGELFDEVTAVRFGGVDAEIIEVVSATELVVRTPPGTPGEQTVIATASNGRASEPLTYTYTIPEPMLESEFEPLAETYLIDASTLSGVDAVGADGSTAELTQVSSFVVTLVSGTALPATGQPIFLEPGTSDLAAGGFAGVVELVLVNPDGSVSVTVAQATFDEVLETFEFEASGAPASDAPLAGQGESFMGVAALIAANETSSAASLVRAIDVNASALECTDPNGVIAADQIEVQVSITLENTRAYATVRSGVGGDYFRSFLYTEPVLSFAGRADAALDCELKTAWVESLKRTLSLGYGLTLSIAPTAKFSISGAGEFSVTKRWVAELGAEVLNDVPSPIANLSEKDPITSFNVELVADAEAGLKVQLGFLDRVGLYAEVALTGLAEARITVVNAESDFCLEFHAGLSAEFGVFLDIWIKRWENSLWNEELPLLEFSQCWPLGSQPAPDIPTLNAGSNIPAYALADRGLAWVPLNGRITADMTLDPSVPGYTILNGLTVDPGVTLRIPAGVIIKMGRCGSIWSPPSPCLRVNGSLVIEGTAATPVVMTAYQDYEIGGDTDGAGADPSAGMWRGILAGPGAVIDIEHAYFRYGQSVVEAKAVGVEVTIANSEFRDGYQTGVEVLASALMSDTVIAGFSSPLILSSDGGLGRGVHGAVRDVTVVGGQVLVISDVLMERTRFENANLRVLNANAQFVSPLFIGEGAQIRASAWGAGASFSGIRAEGVSPYITVESGTLGPGRTVWTAGLPYRVLGPITVPTDSELVLDPGLRIKLPRCKTSSWGDTMACFQVRGGTMLANGTAGRPIWMTSTWNSAVGGTTPGDTTRDGGDWMGFRATEGGALEASHIRATDISGQFVEADGATSVSLDQLHVSNSSVPYSGRREALVRFFSPGQYILTNSFLDVSGYALWVDGAPQARVDSVVIRQGALANYSQSAELVNLHFEGRTNGRAPIEVSAYGAGATISATFGAGVVPGMRVLGGTVGDVTWSSRIPYLIDYSLQIPAGSTLRVAEGTILKLDGCRISGPDRYPCFRVDGSMVVEGTESDPVVMTALNDDTVGGDSTPDDSSLPSQWSYQGIRVSGTGSVDLSGVDARYASELIVSNSTATVSVANSVFSRSSPSSNTALLRLESTSPATVTDVEFVDLTGTTLQISGAPALIDRVSFVNVGRAIRNWPAGTVVRDSTFTNVTTSIESLTYPVSAPRNWWGSPAGPVWSEGPAKVNGLIDDYAPWCLDVECTMLSPE